MIFKRASYLVVLTIFNLGLLMQSPMADSVDDQVREISSLLMCPVCQGQTVEESNSDLAKDMRKMIRKKLQEGKSKEEVIAYFVDRYGETILGAPPVKGTNWLLWLLPAFVLLVGGVGIALFLYRSKEERGKFKEAFKEPEIQAEGEYLERLDKELKEFDS
jgi:cytochrome c-type biogenesis protein CcmH